MAHIFPHSEERIYSEKTPEDIYMILKSTTDSPKAACPSGAEFVGQVCPRDFRIVPKINYRNSFLPVLTGKLTEIQGKTVIDIKARMHILTRIILTIWFVMAYFSFSWGIILLFTGSSGKTTLALWSLGFIIGGQTLIRCCFYVPAQKAFKTLKKLFC